MDKLIIVGSNAFFSGIDGFRSKDVDSVRLVDNPSGFRYIRQINSGGRCMFEIKRVSVEEHISYALNKGAAMQVGKFLVPAFTEEIGFTIEQLPQLQPLIDKLDAKHEYERTIYNAYIANGGFTLTEEQLAEAYAVYKDARGITDEEAEATEKGGEA